MGALKRISDIIPTRQFPENLEPIQALFNRDVILDKVEFGSGQYGEYALLHFRYDDKDNQHVTRTSSRVILEKLHRIEPELPVIMRLVRRRRYYDLE